MLELLIFLVSLGVLLQVLCGLLIWFVDVARFLQINGSGLSCGSLSAIAFCGGGFNMGLWERASGALFRVPLIHCAVKLYPVILCLSCCRRWFSVSSNHLYLLRIVQVGGGQ